ncbi:MAG: trehalose-phosphatase [Planctomycetes bacterium]|nr:trehalose-phosphatase [Planctomycetota bacterium]
MIPDMPAAVGLLRTCWATGSALVLVFDYDGTLVPLAPHPRLARPAPQMLETLDRLTRLCHVHLGVISGRQVAELQELLPVPRLFLAGTSGLEVDFCGVSVLHPRAGDALPVLRQVADRLDSLTRRFPGAWLERKRVGLTLHFRDIATDNAATLVALAAEILRPHSSHLKVHDGPLALEITPDLGWTKGTAIRMMLESLAIAAPMVVYAGDSSNDVDAFEFVEQLGGLTIGIGDSAPALAKYRMESPHELFQWLTSLIQQLPTGCFSHE